MLILGFLMQLLLAMSPSHSKWSKEKKKGDWQGTTYIQWRKYST